MSDPKELGHHAARMLENPAWRALLDGVRNNLDRERDGMALGDEGRLYVSIAETMLTRIERHARTLADSGKVEAFTAATLRRAAGER